MRKTSSFYSEINEKEFPRDAQASTKLKMAPLKFPRQISFSLVHITVYTVFL